MVIEKIHLNDRRFKLREISETIGIPVGWVQIAHNCQCVSTLRECLNYFYIKKHSPDLTPGEYNYEKN